LHRQILEGERGPMEEIERKRIHAELRDRGDGGMAKGPVRLAHHAREIARTDRIADETPDHLDGDFGIRLAAEARDRRRLKPRPAFRHVEAAIAGEACEHRLGEAERWSFPPGRNMAHVVSCGRQRWDARLRYWIYDSFFADSHPATAPSRGHT